MTSARSHIEKTLAEAYRKEIDQEENVWRSLPFFAATLAFQLAALFNMVERLPASGTTLWVEARVLLSLSTVATLIALGYLAASIFPAEFSYIAPEPDLLAYADALDRDEQDATGRGLAPIDAEAVLKAMLARQYAVAADKNRRVNQRRARWRSIAGLATLASVFATIALVVLVVLTYVHRARE